MTKLLCVLEFVRLFSRSCQIAVSEARCNKRFCTLRSQPTAFSKEGKHVGQLDRMLGRTDVVWNLRQCFILEFDDDIDQWLTPPLYTRGKAS